MGQIIVRNLDDAVIARLKSRATANNTSLEQTVRAILSSATTGERDDVWRAIDEARNALKPSTIDSTVLVRQDRDRR